MLMLCYVRIVFQLAIVGAFDMLREDRGVRATKVCSPPAVSCLVFCTRTNDIFSPHEVFGVPWRLWRC